MADSKFETLNDEEIDELLNDKDTVNSQPTDTLVSGQLYLRTPCQSPVLPPSQTLYLHNLVSGTLS